MNKIRFNAVLSTIAVAVTLFAGCTKDEPKRSSIGFKVASQDTKSTIYTTDNIGTALGSFKVDLFDASTGSPIKNIENSDDLGEAVSYSEALEDWGMAHITYWNDQKINTWAYANIEPTTHTSESQSFDFTTNAAAVNQVDVLNAYTAERTSKMDNGVIPIHFFHALSAIQFQFGAQKTGGKVIETGENIIITGITINNIAKSGSYVWDGTSTNSEPGKGFTWNLTGNPRTEYVYQNYNQSVIPGDMVGTVDAGTQSFLLIPQLMNTTSGHESSVTIEWKKDGVEMDPRTTSITTRNGETVEWEPGKRYLYTIRIEKHSLKVDLELTVLPWDSEELTIPYDQSIAVAEGGSLSFSGFGSERTTGSKTQYTFNGTNPIRGQFKLSYPENGTWYVSLTNSTDFEIYTDPSNKGTGTLATGGIGLVSSTDAAVFYIAPKSGLDRTVNHSTKIKISAKGSSGSTLSADDLLNSATYEFALPANI